MTSVEIAQQGLRTAAIVSALNILSPPIGNDLYDGNLGMDVLSQANAVTIDFQSLTLR
jgi:hypothetical protein